MHHPPSYPAPRRSDRGRAALPQIAAILLLMNAISGRPASAQASRAAEDQAIAALEKGRAGLPG